MQRFLQEEHLKIHTLQWTVKLIGTGELEGETEARLLPHGQLRGTGESPQSHSQNF